MCDNMLFIFLVNCPFKDIYIYIYIYNIIIIIIYLFIFLRNSLAEST